MGCNIFFIFSSFKKKKKDIIVSVYPKTPSQAQNQGQECCVGVASLCQLALKLMTAPLVFLGLPVFKCRCYQLLPGWGCRSAVLFMQKVTELGRV